MSPSAAPVPHGRLGPGRQESESVRVQAAAADWRGAIAIEGWHDPVYKDELEITGQVQGLQYLQACRGGPFIDLSG